MRAHPTPGESTRSSRIADAVAAAERRAVIEGLIRELDALDTERPSRLERYQAGTRRIGKVVGAWAGAVLGILGVGVLSGMGAAVVTGLVCMGVDVLPWFTVTETQTLRAMIAMIGATWAGLVIAYVIPAVLNALDTADRNRVAARQQALRDQVAQARIAAREAEAQRHQRDILQAAQFRSRTGELRAVIDPHLPPEARPGADLSLRISRPTREPDTR